MNIKFLNWRILKFILPCFIGLVIFAMNCSRNVTATWVEPDLSNGQGQGGASTTTTTLPLVSSIQCGDEPFLSGTFAMNASINGQHGWFVDPAASFNEQVVNLGGAACRGSGVWKISNSIVSGGFGNQPQSPVLTKANGESSVRDPAGGDSMGLSFFIRTVATVADGSSFTISHSPTSADRHTYLRILNNNDSASGLNIFGIDGVNLDQTHVVASGLNRGSWVHIKIESENPDGVANDIVRVYLNGALVSTISSWEDWRVALPATTLNMTRALFRMSALGTALDPLFTSPQGFYIDDFKQWSYNAATPAVHIEEYSAGFEP